MFKLFGLIGCAVAAFGAQQGWYPHEGGLMKYRVNIRFGEEPKDTMPSGWKFGRVSSVATDSAGRCLRIPARQERRSFDCFRFLGQVLALMGQGHVR